MFYISVAFPTKHVKKKSDQNSKFIIFDNIISLILLKAFGLISNSNIFEQILTKLVSD